MHSSHEFLKALTIVLCVAAVTTVLFQRLRQPVVLGYVIAGLIVGPYTPIPLVADSGTVHILSELGVILLMFSLGLEFSLRKLLRLGPTAGLTAVIQSSIMVWLGFAVGRAFGWTTTESVFTGALIAISSTTIIAKAFDEQRIKGRLRELVVGVLIVEDLIAILLMAILTAVAAGSGLSAGAPARTTSKLALFLVGLVGVGMLVVPRLMRAIVRVGRPETTLVASVGLCFAIALLAQAFGYSVALGAFIAGSLVAESGEEKRVEHVIEPVRDMFAAVFFVSVGMMIDPALIARHWLAVVVLTAVVVVGKVVGVSFGAFVTGNGIRTSVQSGMSLAQIGEFSFIIAGLGLSLKATGEFLYPVAVAVSAVTTLTTPWLIRASGPVAALVDRKLPRPLHTFATLYGSWIERLRAAPPRETFGTGVRRLAGLLALDALLLGVVIGTSLSAARAAAFLGERLGLSPALAQNLVVAVGVACSLPFLIGVVYVARRLAYALAVAALPSRLDGRLDLAAAPRRALTVTLQLCIVVLVSTPVAAITQPFLRGFTGLLVTLGLLTTLAVAFWRSATNLHGHVRAGAQMVVETLSAQSRTAAPSAASSPDLHVVDELLPGLGTPTAVRLAPGSPAVGRSLAQLNLRGVTGATVLAIHRGAGSILVPTAGETLQPADVLALAGTHEALDAARALLLPGGAGAAPPAVERRPA